ncbi:MAG: rod shape-determining protein RodA [Endomicrobiia bacterium]|nr:rod shape-determining protein RodA [Endomicrobiaceae bacterium]MDD3053786.1 rod shape-determining protein RodA [Endomicrobiaceae bacterium]MDD3922791.1 rod shape-determining protein RodA [Endomicrobiaceae bacterium]MDD5101804.1 rod shape-determining protein RodA [Endomicrobiaceae bacterium]
MFKNISIFSRIIKNIDWIFWISLIFLTSIGFVAIYSASLNYDNPMKFITTQFAAFIIGLIGIIFLASFNYQYYKHFNSFIYALSCLLLISVLIFGTTVRATKGWFNFGFFSFQPVEVTKIMLILVLSAFLDNHWKDIKKLSILCKALCITGGHIFLIMLQPDFSSTLSYFPVTLILLYVTGAKLRHLLSIILYGSLAMGIPLFVTFFKLQPELLRSHKILNFFVNATTDFQSAVLILGSIIILVFLVKWFLNKLRIPVGFVYPIIFLSIIIAGAFSSVVVEKSLKDYQRKRLIVFLKPEVDSRGAGYNIIQSKIAIGSGKILGKGFFKGTQTQLGFLPEQRTDFIFSVVGEEGGYLLSQLTILFYFFFVWRALVIAQHARDRYGSLVATGIATMFAFYGIINIGMVMGLMPATGLPLLLLSYGGSSMFSSMIAIGILLSIHLRRFNQY